MALAAECPRGLRGLRTSVFSRSTLGKGSCTDENSDYEEESKLEQLAKLLCQATVSCFYLWRYNGDNCLGHRCLG